jgi:hypothetical protein
MPDHHVCALTAALSLKTIMCVFVSLGVQKLMDLAKKQLSVQETWETRYEQLMEQFASDMRLYMGMVRHTLDCPAPDLPSARPLCLHVTLAQFGTFNQLSTHGEQLAGQAATQLGPDAAGMDHHPCLTLCKVASPMDLIDFMPLHACTTHAM